MIRQETVKKILSKIKDQKIYRRSIRIKDNNAFSMVKKDNEKYLLIIGNKKTTEQFEGEVIERPVLNGDQFFVRKAALSFGNQKKLHNIFPDISPVTCKNRASFGTGDRLGLVTAAHIGSFNKKDIFPVLAQQSVRELDRTHRNWKDVIASAIWGYFEAGVRIQFGSDADHVKEKEDLKEAVDAGFTMFTIDPSDHIADINGLSRPEIEDIYNSFPLRLDLESRYLNKKFLFGNQKVLLDKNKLIPIAARYMKAIKKVTELYDVLRSSISDKFDFEVSMDEIEEPVTPLEHYFISSELFSAGVEFDNLALRYPGRWEKAIDYVGDIDGFEADLHAHSEISGMFGRYKLSLHSGSEKFLTYPAFSGINEGNFHIKTAGTSYLEAIRTISEADTELFRKIYTRSLESFENDRDSYHLSTDISKLTGLEKVSDRDLKDYLDLPESRQVLHVAFGTILTDPVLKERLYSVLIKNEDTHYRYAKDNITKHLDYLKMKGKK